MTKWKDLNSAYQGAHISGDEEAAARLRAEAFEKNLELHKKVEAGETTIKPKHVIIQD